MEDTNGLNHCPQCKSVEFYWDQERWLHYCNACGFELDPDDPDEYWYRCFDCDYLFWQASPKQCPACTGRALQKEESSFAVIRFD